MKICEREGCDGKVLARGICNKHYHEYRKQKESVNPCACGCGELVRYKFKSGHHTRLLSSEEQSRRSKSRDYDVMRARYDAIASRNSYRKVNGRHEHRAVAEKMLGRSLRDDEVVHHKDHNKRNNDPSNLEVMTQSEHAKLHMEERLNDHVHS